MSMSKISLWTSNRDHRELDFVALNIRRSWHSALAVCAQYAPGRLARTDGLSLATVFNTAADRSQPPATSSSRGSHDQSGL
jgi:hypothetical protein